MRYTLSQALSPKHLTLARILPYVLLIGGVVDVFCSFVLSLDTIDLLKNPHFVPNCNLNPVISCGSVMHSQESELFGIPNPLIGLVSFAVIATVGATLLAGAQFKRWFWIAFEAGITAGGLFGYWLLVMSIYKIQALCPFCLTVDAVMAIIFWYVLLYMLGKGYERLPEPYARVVRFARRHHLEILVAWFLFIIVLILQHFWYYYGQFI
jgi:uncharacterized membrane protein